MKSLYKTLTISILLLAVSFLNTMAANACGYPAISRVQELGFMQGISATEFAPFTYWIMYRYERKNGNAL